MGLLRDYFIKDKDKKFCAGLVIDVLIVLVFIYMSLNLRQEWLNGYNYCEENACLICMRSGKYLNVSEMNLTKILVNETFSDVNEE